MDLSGVAEYLSSLDDTVKGALASVPGGESVAKAFGFGPPPVCQPAPSRGACSPRACVLPLSADGAIDRVQEYASNEEGEEISFMEKLGNALYSMCIGLGPPERRAAPWQRR